MKQLMAKSKPLTSGTVIMAESQTAGRGQYQNGWHSQAGKNLTFSLLLSPPAISPNNIFCLNMAISVAINDVLRVILGDKTSIKWPNDLYYADKKLGGILIENSFAGNKLNYSVIGVGLNVNQEEFPETLPNPTSLRQLLKKEFDIKEVLSQICGSIEIYYNKLVAGETEIIKQQYLQQLYGFGKALNFKAGDAVFTGIICGINQSGQLGVQTLNKIDYYDLKQIRFLHN